MNPLSRFLLSLFFATTAIAQTADLRMPPLQTQQPPGRFSVVLAMVNLGPDTARGTVLTIDVPAGVTVDPVAAHGVPCDATQRPIRCLVGDFPKNTPAYGGFDVITPPGDATYTVKVTLTSDTPDPDPSNNSQTVTWQTRVEADLGAGVFTISEDRVDPDGTVEFFSNVCNNIRENRKPAVVVTFTPVNGTIQSITEATGFACSNEGVTARCTIAELPDECPRNPFRIRVRANADRRGGDFGLIIDANGDVPEKNPADNRGSKLIRMYRWISVTNTADSGPGSLRAAFDDANANCTPGPCRIVFEIPPPVPAEGWFTITPATPLPDVTAARVAIEGSRQTALTGDTNPKGPEIAIDGRLAGRGLKMVTTCEAVVDGLAIGNFSEDQGLWVGTHATTAGACDGLNARYSEVKGNHIGVDPTGEVAWPNLRGLRLDFSGTIVRGNVISRNRYSGIWMWTGWAYIQENAIQDNGASGAFFGPQARGVMILNFVTGNREMGVAVARGVSSLDLRRNAFKGNGALAIDWGLDGPSTTPDDRNGPVNAPVLLAARYDAVSNTTVVDVIIPSADLTGLIEIRANATSDAEGESPAGEQWGKPSQIKQVTLHGDFRGKWLNATWTRVGDPDWGPWLTSEFGNAILVE